MKHKILLFFILIITVACSTSKSVVRTSSSQPKVANSPRKPVHKPLPVKKALVNSTNSSESKNDLKSTSTEILEATTRVKVTTEMVLAYIEKYKAVAKDNMIKTGIPASITLGQAILESGAGTGPLSVQANNHFGIKCHNEWTGPIIRYTDDEENECFRKYSDPSQSYKDHSFFLTSRPRYASLFQLDKTDYASWAKGLKASGYATDPKYPDKLIGLIERYKLYQFDAEVIGSSVNFNKQNLVVSENSTIYTVVKGDTLYSIAKKFNVTVEQLKKSNNILDNTISLGQNIIVK